MKDSTKSYLITALGMLIIIACSFPLFEGIREHVDLVLADDSAYLNFSYKFPFKIKAGYGPGYVVIFKLFGYIFKDPIDIHYNVMVFLTILPAISLFLMLRMMKMAASLALILAVFLLYSNLNMSFDWWSRISHYSTSLFLLFMAFSIRFKKTSYFLLSSTFVAFLLSYVRPETFLTFLVLLLCSIAYIIYKGRKELTKTGFAVIVMAAAFMIVVNMIVGNPMAGGSRLALALAQHYVLNLTIWNDLPLTECLYWPETFKNTFGDATSFGELWQNGKPEIIHHLTSNFNGYFSQTFRELSYMLLPEKVFGLKSSLVWIVIAILYIGYIAWVGLQDYFEQVVSKISKHFSLLFVTFLFFGPTLASSFVIFPREHYLVLQLPFFYLVLFILISPKKPGSRIPRILNKGIPFLITGLILFLVAPKVEAYPTKYPWGSYDEIRNVNTIKTIRNLEIEEKRVQLLATKAIQAYLSENYRWVASFNKTVNYNRFMDSLDINMVYVDEILQIDRRFGEDEEFQYFLKNYESIGWKKEKVEEIKNGDYYILYDGNLKP